MVRMFIVVFTAMTTPKFSFELSSLCFEVRSKVEKVGVLQSWAPQQRLKTRTYGRRQRSNIGITWVKLLNTQVENLMKQTVMQLESTMYLEAKIITRSITSS